MDLFSNFKPNKKEERKLVVADIGCRWGFAERFLQENDKGKYILFGFDPDEVECQKLQAHYDTIQGVSIRCIPLGLAGASGKRNLYITKDPACSSLYPPRQFLVDSYPALGVIELEKIVSVTVATLKEWAIQNHIQAIDYIKVDTQGSELEILQGFGVMIETTRCIDIEVEFNPIYEGQSLFFETDSYLRGKGFQLWRLSNLVHYTNGGTAKPLNEKNSIRFDTLILQELQAHEGQLFWADARYVHSDVLDWKPGKSVDQLNRDITLFNTLGMTEIVNQLSQKGVKGVIQ